MKRKAIDRRWLILSVLVAVILALISTPVLAADELPGAPQTGIGVPFDWIDLVAGAFVIPWIVQIAKRWHWDDEKTRAAAFGLTVAYTVGRYWQAGELDHVQDWSVTIGAVMATAQVSYNTVLKSKFFAAITAALGSLNKGPNVEEQRAGFKGLTPETPPPG